MGEHGEWFETFSPRERQEIRFALLYSEHFGHGTDGHNAKMIIAKLANILDANHIENLPPQPDQNQMSSV